MIPAPKPTKTFHQFFSNHLLNLLLGQEIPGKREPGAPDILLNIYPPIYFPRFFSCFPELG
jgi:hypothetical protein